MKYIISGLLLLTSFSALSATYQCGRREVEVKTAFFSDKVTSVNGIKVTSFGPYTPATEKFEKLRSYFERYHDAAEVAEVYAEDYRVFGNDNLVAFSRGVFERAPRGYMISITRPGPWCMWDACQTYYEMESCTRI